MSPLTINGLHLNDRSLGLLCPPLRERPNTFSVPKIPSDHKIVLYIDASATALIITMKVIVHSVGLRPPPLPYQKQLLDPSVLCGTFHLESRFFFLKLFNVF